MCHLCNPNNENNGSTTPLEASANENEFILGLTREKLGQAIAGYVKPAQSINEQLDSMGPLKKNWLSDWDKTKDQNPENLEYGEPINEEMIQWLKNFLNKALENTTIPHPYIFPLVDCSGFSVEWPLYLQKNNGIRKFMDWAKVEFIFAGDKVKMSTINLENENGEESEFNENDENGVRQFSDYLLKMFGNQK